MDCLIANTRDAFRFGQPNVLNYHGPNNPDTDKNRREACRNFRPIHPDRNSCDEYPYATTIQGGIQGGAGANIRAVNIGEQRRQGGDLSSVYRRIPPGTNGAFQVILVTPAIRHGFPEKSSESIFQSDGLAGLLSSIGEIVKHLRTNE